MPSAPALIAPVAALTVPCTKCGRDACRIELPQPPAELRGFFAAMAPKLGLNVVQVMRTENPLTLIPGAKLAALLSVVCSKCA